MKFLLPLLIFYCAISCKAQDLPALYGDHSVTAGVLINNGGRGIGLRYELLFSGNHKWALVLPVAICRKKVDVHVSPGGASMGIHEETVYPKMYFFSPGIRFYPTTSRGVSRYSIGVSAMIGIGKGAKERYTNPDDNLYSKSITGLLLTQSIHLHFTPHIPFSIELDMGYGSEDIPLGQLGVNIGYRW